MFKYFNLFDRYNFFFLVLSVGGIIVVETVAYAILIPLIQVFTIGKIASDFDIIQQILSVETPKLVLLLCGVFLIKNIIIVTLLFLQNKAISSANMELAQKLYRNIFRKPLHHNVDAIESVRVMNAEVRVYIISFIFQVVQLVTESIFLLTFLFVSVTISSMSLLLCLIPTVVAIFWYQNRSRQKLAVLGEQRIKNDQLRSEHIFEAISGREVWLHHNMYDFFFKRFDTLNKEYKHILLWTNFYQQIPRGVFETFACISILLLYVLEPVNFGNNFIVLAVIVTKGLPSAAKITVAAQSINAARASVSRTNVLLGSAEQQLHASNNANTSTSGLIVEHAEFGDFHFQRGKVNVITGPSGCGKTTLLRDIVHNSNKVQTFQRMSTGKSMYLPSLNYMPQEVPLFSDNFAKNTIYSSAPPDSYERVVAQLGLTDLDTGRFMRSEGVDQISGGQKQRLGLIRCLMFWSDLNLLDEPTSALSETAKKHVYKLLNDFSKKNSGITVVVTHDLSMLTGDENIIEIKK